MIGATISHYRILERSGFFRNRTIVEGKPCTLHRCWESPRHKQCWFRVMPPLHRTPFINDGALIYTLGIFDVPLQPRISPCTHSVPQTGVLTVFSVFAVS